MSNAMTADNLMVTVVLPVVGLSGVISSVELAHLTPAVKYAVTV
jgi:hypothetical protein